jgi:glycosyltransferase involved in cell wall biosynthesis
VRADIGLPQEAVVIGSFQKDGIGWGEGTEPKLIKGPDILLAVLARLRRLIPALHVLLTGAARGYVKRGLERLGIPYRHVHASEYAEVGRLYHAVDLTLVTSREEGGPKAMLESMCSGIPLVSTRVGQAGDLVVHGQNGWLAEVEDVDGLVGCALEAIGLSADARLALQRTGRATADEHSYENQLPLWRAFFTD